MSIRFAPYTSKYQHVGMKIYHPSASIGNMGITYRTSNHSPQIEQIHVPINDSEWVELHNLILDADDGFQHERKRKFILQDFATIIQRITNHFTASIWNTIKACPLLTIHEVLWLKVDDIDGRVDHLEKMLITAIEENQLLQRKIDVDRSEKRLIQVLEENNLLQRKMEQVLNDHVDKILHEMRERDVLYELD